MLLESWSLWLVDWDIFRHHIFSLHSFLPWEATNHYCDVNPSAGLHNIGCGNNTCCKFWSDLMIIQLIPYNTTCYTEKTYYSSTKISLAIWKGELRADTFKKRKRGIYQLHLHTIQCLSCRWDIKHVEDHRLVRTKHHSPGNHGNEGISNLSCKPNYVLLTTNISNSASSSYKTHKWPTAQIQKQLIFHIRIVTLWFTDITAIKLRVHSRTKTNKPRNKNNSPNSTIHKKIKN